jgi:hypothetical protein
MHIQKSRRNKKQKMGGKSKRRSNGRRKSLRKMRGGRKYYRKWDSKEGRFIPSQGQYIKVKERFPFVHITQVDGEGRAYDINDQLILHIDEFSKYNECDVNGFPIQRIKYRDEL